MKLSTKGRYGLRAMIDLAIHSKEEAVSIASIAARQKISESYLEQLIPKLRKAGMIVSVRGAGGGYMLAKPAKEISVGDILRALEGSWILWIVRDFRELPDVPHPAAVSQNMCGRRLMKALIRL